MTSIGKLIAKLRNLPSVRFAPKDAVQPYIWVRHDEVLSTLTELEQALARESAAPLSPENEVALKALHAAAGKGPSAAPAAPECTCANNPLNSWPNLPHDKNCPLAARSSEAAPASKERSPAEIFRSIKGELRPPEDWADRSSERDAPAVPIDLSDILISMRTVLAFAQRPDGLGGNRIAPNVVATWIEKLEAIRISRDAIRREVLEEAARVIDQCNREGPYNAIQGASRIRALAAEPAGRKDQREDGGSTAADIANATFD